MLQVTGLDHMALAASPEDVVELDDENAISQRPNHYSFRTDFLRAALERLSCVQTGGSLGASCQTRREGCTTLHPHRLSSEMRSVCTQHCQWASVGLKCNRDLAALCHWEHVPSPDVVRHEASCKAMLDLAGPKQVCNSMTLGTSVT